MSSTPIDLDEMERLATPIPHGFLARDEHDVDRYRLVRAMPALIAEVRALRAALVKYGAHTGMCGYEGGPKSNPKTGYRCVCGLYDLVDEDEFTAALRQEE